MIRNLNDQSILFSNTFPSLSIIRLAIISLHDSTTLNPHARIVLFRLYISSINFETLFIIHSPVRHADFNPSPFISHFLPSVITLQFEPNSRCTFEPRTECNLHNTMPFFQWICLLLLLNVLHLVPY